MSGWISIHRKILEHWIYADKPFDKRSAWIDLIFLANFVDNERIFNKKAMTVKRGSLITSEYRLSERWGWTRKKVRAFLELLEKDKMISKKATVRYSYITILNYNSYQFESIRLETVETVVDTTYGTTETIDIQRFETRKGTTKGTTQVEQLFEEYRGTTEGTTETIDIQRFETCKGTTKDTNEGTQVQGTTLEAYRGTTQGTTETIDIQRFETCKGTTEELGGGGASGTHYNNRSISLVTLGNNNKSSSSSVNKVPNVIEREEGIDWETLEKIFTVSNVGIYSEKTALFIKSVLTKLWGNRTIPVTWNMDMNHEQIRECLRYCRLEHYDKALEKTAMCKKDKRIYFAKALISAITESGIEEIFTEEG